MKGVSKNRGRAHVLALVAMLLAAALLPLQVTFAAPEAKISVSPPKTSYEIGEKVTIEGTGWWVLSEVRIYLNRTDKMFYITSVRTNETGGFTVKVTIPAVKPDTYTWLVTQPGTPNVNKSAPFNIEPGIYLTPTRAPVGAEVRILGAHAGFAGKKVCIIFDIDKNGKLDPGEILANVTGDAEGIINASIRVPDVKADTYTIYANYSDINPQDLTANTLSKSIQVLQPIIVIKPEPEAPVGGQITVEGNYFKVGYRVNITLVRDTSVVATLATKVPTNATGGFKVSVTVPDVKVTTDMEYTINATDDINFATKKTLTVKAPEIIIDPTTAKVGDSITVKANWFKVKSNVIIYFSIWRSGTVYELIPVATVPANATGGFVTTVKVPSVPAETPAVDIDLVKVNASDGVNFAIDDFDVEASVKLEPYRAAVGSTVKVIGTGFSNGSTVSITIANGATVTMEKVAKTDNYGSFEASITVPQIPDGSYTLTVTDEKDVSAEALLQVVPKEFADLFAAIDAIERKLDSETFGLAAIKSAIDLLDARVRAIVYRLGSFTGEDTVASLLYDIRAKVEAIQLDLTPVLNAVNSTRTDILGAIASAKEEILAKIDFTPVLKAVNGTRTDILNAISGAKTDLSSAISSAKSDIIARIDKITAPAMSTGTGKVDFKTKDTEIAIYESAKLGTVTVTLKTSGMLTYKVLSIRYYINPADPTLYVEKVVARNADAVFTDTAAAWKVTLVYTETATPAKPGVTVYYAYSALTPP